MRSSVRRAVTAWLVLGVACVAAPGRSAAQERGVLLAVAGRTNANVSLAARGDTVVAVWSATEGTTTDIYAALSADGGRRFSAPTRVNDVAGDARVSGEQPPRAVFVVRGGLSSIVVIWTSKRAAGTRLLWSESTNGARSFRAAQVVPGGEAAGNRGWESVAVDERGRVFVLWLDHREAGMPAAMHHEGMAMDAPRAAVDPVQKAGLSQLFITSIDGAVTRQVARGVCYCCKTALVASHGVLYAAWRHVFAGNQRDIGFAISRDGGATFNAPARVHADGWAFDGCPENGPAVVVDNARRAHVFWPAPPDGALGTPLGLFHASTRDGVAFTARVALPIKGPASHVSAVLDAGGAVVVAWEESTRRERTVAMARATTTDNGAISFRRVKLDDVAGDAWRPALASTRGGVVLAWHTEAGLRVMRVAR